ACTSLALPITDVLLTGFDDAPPTTTVRVVLVVSSRVATDTPAAVAPPTSAPTTAPTTNCRQPGPRERPPVGATGVGSTAGGSGATSDAGGGGPRADAAHATATAAAA